MIIPALDLHEGQTVRLYQGDYDRVSEFDVDPLTLISEYRDQGAEFLHLVDLSGARSTADSQALLLQALISKSTLPIQVGGGIRTLEDAKQRLDWGATRVVIGSRAVDAPGEVRRWMETLGDGRVVLALDVDIDAKQNMLVPTHGWRTTGRQSLQALLEFYQDSPALDILCTDISRDGAMQGPNLELYAKLVKEYPRFRWQASGGVRSLEDIIAVRKTGADSIIVGRALLEGHFNVKDAVTCWPAE